MPLSLPQQIASLPLLPGIYLFRDLKGHVLYVGKAKKLRSRVKSYFSKPLSNNNEAIEQLSNPSNILKPNPALDPSKIRMIPKITTLETIVTDTENEALILEASLIRQHQPPYNVVLRDDKFYLFIKITTYEDFPRVFLTRKLANDKARYFGPYSSAAAARATLNLLRRLFPHHGETDSPREVIFPHPLFSLDGRWNPQRSPRKSWSAHLAKASLGEGEEGDHPAAGGEAPTERPPAEALAKAGAAGVARAPDQQKKDYTQNIQNIIRFLRGERDEIINTLRIGMRAASKQKN
jgi:excinuclease UvrABC nuclease subunit